MRAISTILYIILFLAVLLLGGGIGFYFGTQNPVFSAKTLANAEESNSNALIKKINSKVISSISASGKVENINGRNLTLSNSGDSVVIKITDNAQVFSFAQPDAINASTAQKQAAFSDIKNGDNVNVGVKMMPDGSLSGEFVYILPTIKIYE